MAASAYRCLIAAMLAVAAMPVAAHADELPRWDVDDKPGPVFVWRMVSELETKQDNVPESYGDTAYGAVTSECEYTPTSEYIEPYTASESLGEYAPTDGLTQDGGINYHDGRLETYYSSNVLPHYRMGEWTTDDEGFWRTDDGYYVVAASDMEQGTVFEGSKGTCVVLDTGCAPGTTDYYVSW